MNTKKFKELLDYYTHRHTTEKGIDGWTYLFGDKIRVKVGSSIKPPPLRLQACFYNEIPDVQMHAFKTGKFGIKHNDLELMIHRSMWEYQDWECRETKLFSNAKMRSGSTEVFLIPFNQATVLAYHVLCKHRKDKMQEQLELPFEESA